MWLNFVVRQWNKMGEIVNFFKEMFNMDTSERCPVGLCSFEHAEKSAKKKKVVKKAPHKKEMRLSELME